MYSRKNDPITIRIKEISGTTGFHKLNAYKFNVVSLEYPAPTCSLRSFGIKGIVIDLLLVQTLTPGLIDFELIIGRDATKPLLLDPLPRCHSNPTNIRNN